MFETLSQSWDYISSGRVLAIIFGVGFALLAVTFFIASRTKWGHSKPFTKCVVLSVLAHVWLLMYALGSRTILPQGDPNGKEQNVSISFEDDIAGPEQTLPVPDLSNDSASDSEPLPWEKPVPLDELPLPDALETATEPLALEIPDLLPALEPTPLPALPPPELLGDMQDEQATSDQSITHDSSATATTEIAQNSEAPSQLAQSPVEPQPPITPPESGAAAQTPTMAIDTPNSYSPQTLAVANQYSPVLPPMSQVPHNPNLPREYQLRQAPNRLQLAAAYGADADSEAAVNAGLQWLSSAQSPDGAWVAQDFGAGRDTKALGATRGNTGQRADTGVSGLALLAFLSAGHTHMAGDHQQTVAGGLRFLIDSQMPSGDLSGPKQVGRSQPILNARMYCHGIATLALAEAYAMTHDAHLKDALLRAAQYTINAQDIHGGGWRYSPREPGDLSQFGWQAMALKSVQRSGIAIPAEVEQRMRQFLDSCSSGRSGGLATYRPREGRPSETMTAEGLACRLMLDYPLSPSARREATDMIMSQRPGTHEDNVYFWYYATLALFQLQDDNWRQWNQAMKSRLLQTQIPSYRDQPGSWDPDSLWGGYGGRVYSTAMSCLCLEVYYRYLPMYQRANIAGGRRNNGYLK